MFFTLLSHLPEPVMVLISTTLLILIAGSLIIVISVLLSEVACGRLIRLLNAIAKLTGKDIDYAKQRRRRNK